jgi:hypothetical protein
MENSFDCVSVKIYQGAHLQGRVLSVAVVGAEQMAPSGIGVGSELQIEQTPSFDH